MLDERHFVLAYYHAHSDECYDRDDRTCELNEERLYGFLSPSKEQLIGWYLDVDPKALSLEKDAMYEELVAGNEQ